MTSIRRDGTEQSSFAAWVRANPRLESRRYGLGNLDIDWIWHQWRVKGDRVGARKLFHVMIIEEKSADADLSFDERETLWALDQAYSRRTTWKARTLRGEIVTVSYWGAFKLRYSGTCLEDSQRIWWNKRQVSLGDLEEILRFERDPRTLAKRDLDRRHHLPRSQPLFSGQEY